MTRHPRPRSSLEYGTKLVEPREAGWSFTLYPEAAEGGGSFRSAARDSPGATRRPTPTGTPRDAARRARAKVRRYCAANRLNRLGTLTYAGDGCHDPVALRADMAGVLPSAARRRRRALPVPVGPGVASRRPWAARPLRRRPIDRASGAIERHGVAASSTSSCSATCRSAREPSARPDSPRGTSPSTSARTSATADSPPGCIGTRSRRASSRERSRSMAHRRRGPRAGPRRSWATAPERVWRSRDEAEWAGPPALWASWA